jgi:hypothetical protein
MSEGSEAGVADAAGETAVPAVSAVRPTTTTTGTTTTTTTKHMGKPVPRKGGVTAGCQVPFTRAPDGTKIPKPECF